jgi:hypothetical protein
MATKKLDFVILQGDTFTRVIRWEALPYVYKAITAITKAAPASITAATHGLATGWRVAVVSVLGMTEINAASDPPKSVDFHQCTVVDPNTITLNDVNSSEFSAYVSGGYLQYYTPVNLSGFTARMTIKNKIGGTSLLTLTSGAPDNRIAIDNAAHTITLTISATDTASMTFTQGVYDLELVSPVGVVTKLYRGGVTVLKEVTT